MVWTVRSVSRIVVCVMVVTMRSIMVRIMRPPSVVDVCRVMSRNGGSSVLTMLAVVGGSVMVRCIPTMGHMEMESGTTMLFMSILT